MAHKLYTLLYVVVCFVLLCTHNVRANEEEDERRFKVLHLTDKTFDKYLSKNVEKDVLVMFYAPWCGHCKAMKPDFEEVYNQVKKGQQVLAAVDCTTSKKVCQRFKIEGYPTLKFFKRETREELPFYGSRTIDGIHKFLAKPVEEEIFATSPGSLRILTSANFDKFIKDTPAALVMFYAPWCGHCKQLGPIFKEAAAKVEQEGTGVLAVVDCVKYPEIGRKFEVTAYPVVKHFKNGKPNLDYDGKRTTKDILAFMRNPAPYVEPPAWKETKSDVVHLKDSTFDDFIAANDATLVMFYAPWCSHCQEMKDDFTSAASAVLASGKGRLAAVDCTTEIGLKDKFSIPSFPTLKYIRKDKPTMDYTGGRNHGDIVEFMKNPAVPWSEVAPEVAHLSGDAFEEYIQSKSPVLVMFYAPWCGHCKNLKGPYAEAATRVKSADLGTLAAVDCTVDSKICQDYGIEAYPTLQYIVDGKKKFDYTGQHNADGLYDYMKSPKGKEAPPPPEPWNENVAQLTDKTFKNFIKENEAVLVMFHAPWCGHCKNLKPNFEAAAVQIKDLGLGVLAAVDCTAQPEIAKKYKISGYPTVKYFKNGKFEMDFELSRTTDAIVSFMKKPSGPPPPPAAEPFSTEPNEVELLTDKNFDTFIKSNEAVLVMFYAPWCGHCKNMKPAYIEAASEVKQKKFGVLAAVDATVSQATAAKFKVQGYPTIKYFKNGKFDMDYELSRTKDGLVSFMESPSVPPPPPQDNWDAPDVTMLTAENFDQFVKEHDTVLTMFYAPWCGHCKKMKPVLSEAATKLKTLGNNGAIAGVDCTTNGELCSKHGVSGYPTFKGYEKGVEDTSPLSARSLEAVLEYFEVNTHAHDEL